MKKLLLLCTVILCSPLLATAQAPAVKAPLLTERPIDTPAAAASKGDPIVYMAPHYYDPQETVATALLRRELFRQALLLAARDELGQVTRDSALREEVPADFPAGHRLYLYVQLVAGKQNLIRLDIGDAASAKIYWKGEADQPATEAPDWVTTLELAEGYSRREFVKALQHAGLNGKANENKLVGAPLDAIEKLLGEMTFYAQYSAVRQLHDYIRTNGETPAVLGQLSRAYAHLGVLTDTQWDEMTWVFKARSLLYAQRLIYRTPTSPLGLWHRAYAEGLVGLQAQALTDLNSVAQMLAPKAGDPKESTPPGWIPLVEALCKFDLSKLRAIPTDANLIQLANLLHFLSVEQSKFLPRIQRAGDAVLKLNPECFRVRDGMSRVAIDDQFVGFKTFSEKFLGRVGNMPSLPKSVSDSLIRPNEPETIKALIAAGREKSGEMSWSVLGRYAQETRFNQIRYRIALMKIRGEAPESFFASVRPLIADHSLVTYLDSECSDWKQRDKQYADLLRALTVPGINYRHAPLLKAFRALGGTEWGRRSTVAMMHSDYLYRDASLILQTFLPTENSTDFAKKMLMVNYYAPEARVALIEQDWKNATTVAAQWEKEDRNGEVLAALASRALREARNEDAQRLLNEAMRISADQHLFQMLARSFLADGKESQWLDMLETYITSNVSEEDKTEARLEIADYFFKKKEYARALTYAEKAAESKQIPAIRMAYRCAEKLTDADNTDKWAKILSETDPRSIQIWYSRCLRTGKGDLVAARKLVEQAIAKDPNGSRELIFQGFLHATGGKPALAPDFYLASHNKTRNDMLILLAAVEYDVAGEGNKRDVTFSYLRNDSNLKHLSSLIQDLVEADEKEEVNTDLIEANLSPMSPLSKSQANYLIGKILLKHGHEKEGIKHLEEAVAANNDTDNILSTLATLTLQGLKKK